MAGSGSGSGSRAEARSTLRVYQQKLLQGAGFLLHGLEHILSPENNPRDSFNPNSGDNIASSSSVEVPSTGLALEQVFALKMCARAGKEAADMSSQRDEEGDEGEEEQYDYDDDVEAASGEGAGRKG